MATTKLTVPIILEWKDIEAYMAQHDIVEVVRCKDCKYHEDEAPGMLWCPHIAGCWVNENWFCADGGRKETDETN